MTGLALTVMELLVECSLYGLSYPSLSTVAIYTSSGIDKRYMRVVMSAFLVMKVALR